MKLNLDEKVILVGGASRGIGLGVVEACLKENARVVLVSRDKESLLTTLENLRANYGSNRVWAKAGDLRSTTIVEEIVTWIESEIGPVSGAVSNIGLHPCPPGFDVDDEIWTSGFDQNLNAPYRFGRTVLRRMTERGEGSLVFITSSAGLASLGGPITYDTAKAALNHLTKQLARYVAHSGVRVNAIAPGPISFPGGEWEERMNGPKSEKWQRWIHREIPLRRLGAPKDIGSVAALLLSPVSGFVTGAVWPVDGGHTR